VQLPQAASELEPVLEEAEIGDELRWPCRLNLRDDRRELLRSTCVVANDSIERTIVLLGTPAAFATAARSVPAPVAVGNPPTESSDSLSKITCMRFLGRYRPSVVRPPRFMSTEPSPSNTTTGSSGRLSAIPRPTEDASPMACCR
jgi:hypothetical protein